MNAEAENSPKRLRVRFSVRVLLLAVPVVALLLYWWDSPRRVARRFAERVNAGDFGAAQAMIGAPGHDLIYEWMIHKGSSEIRMKAEVGQPEWEDLWERKTPVLVEITIDGSLYQALFISARNGISTERLVFLGDSESPGMSMLLPLDIAKPMFSVAGQGKGKPQEQ